MYCTPSGVVRGRRAAHDLDQLPGAVARFGEGVEQGIALQ